MSAEVLGDKGRAYTGTDPHLRTARIGAVLSGILREIRVLYVVGLNAQLIVGRVEAGGAGFERISARLYDLARETAHAIEQANRLSVEVCRVLHRFRMAEEACRPLREARSLGARSVRWQECQRLRRELQDDIRQLLECLRQLEGQVEAADYLAVNARVEASKARVRGGRSDLDGVADSIRGSVGQIRATVERVRPDLEALQHTAAAA